MRVTELHLYPVKSLGGLPLERASVEPWGLAGDRRWALVDDTGDVVTARQVHELLRLTAEVIDEQTIRILDRADGGSILVDTPLGLDPVPIDLSRLPVASPADEDVNGWLTRRLGTRVRLVWQEDPTARTISGAHGGMPGDHVSMADTGPLLLASEASMAQLNAWIVEESGAQDPPDLDPDDLSDTSDTSSTSSTSSTTSTNLAEPVLITRFRPNVVIDGEAPFAEDAWPTVRIGDVRFRTTELCDRCVMTTIDPVTLAGGKEPIRTLARHRRWDGRTWFGIRLVPLAAGEIAVGDTVTGVAR